MAVLLLDPASLPSTAALGEVTSAKPGLRAALKLICLPAAAAVAAAAASEPAEGPLINGEEFEFFEQFDEEWEQRWFTGPATQDESGKPIRQGLIKATLTKYPSDPKVAKRCFQLVGGAANAPCTGIYTSFAPLCRPTEVEFEFTMNGKVDLPNANIVFTERPFEGALPDTKIGVQFMVRGGMQLSGGAGSLVKISNDGKIQPDKWNKVLLKIDWGEKVIVAQVDTRGKGYAPAIQTVPFRDTSCAGFGFLYIYNTDMQGTCWFSSMRIKQEIGALPLDTEALDARAHLAARMKEREYQRAVDADMEVGMKMGAIKSTAQHGLNLAQEQLANNSSGMAR